MRRALLMLCFFAAAATVLAAVAYLMLPQQPALPPALAARRALASGDFAAAERLAIEAATESNTDLFLVAADAALRQEKPQLALNYFARVEGDDPRRGFENLLVAGEALAQGARPLDAERKFQVALDRRPHDLTPHNKLALLYLTTGRRRDAAPHLLEAVRQGGHTVHTLCLLGQSEGANFLPPQYRTAVNATSADPLLLLALASHEIQRSEWESARRDLEKTLELEPDLVEAQAQLGKVLWELGERPAFESWASRTSDPAKTHPLTWHLLGLWAERNAPPETALRCFGEALRTDSDFVPSNYRLGQLLDSRGRSQDAAPFLERASELERLAIIAGVLYQNPRDLPKLREASQICERLGRLWESWGWAQIASQLTPGDPWPQQQMRLLASRLSPELPRVAHDHRPVAQLDLSEWPLPKISNRTATQDTVHTSSESDIRFTDDAAAVGLVTSYSNGSEAGTLGHRMHQFTGGGIGVIDFDGDHRPDIFFTQGGSFPPDHASGPSDKLFRNLGKSFIDVTKDSHSEETLRGFGQGVASGDLDGDGFADLYVANIGQNRLLRNNGDGTFSDITSRANLPDLPLNQSWTTSVAMVDLTGDGLPDLYDTNYVTAPDVFDRVCQGADGSPQNCPPTAFEACPDRLLVNLGDGRFADQTAKLGINGRNGNGLGVVAADLNRDRQLDLFVANDQTANHLYIATSTEEGERAFQESALSTGLALDQNGRAQACMGIATGDIDGDGHLDLFVTNFYLESNTLYRQLPGSGSFEDRSAQAGLREHSLKMLGFGTQFLDADLDGWPDLVVTNGHIDDFSATGTPHRMRPQFFRNRGGRFEELEPARLGPFFQLEQLGRSLARLDWNRDGRDDFVVSHLDTPAALLTNRSEATRGLGLRLVATKTARDAVGTVVVVESRLGKKTLQLTAGDGYQASNERKLTVGVGDAASARITVEWPSGFVEVFDQQNTELDYLIVEGRGRMTPLSSASDSH